MIERSVNRVLTTLDRVYGFIGRQTATDSIDLGTISLVHDVSREGELIQAFPHVATFGGTTDGLGGVQFGALTFEDYITSAIVNVSAGDPAAQLVSRNLKPADVDIWLLGTSATIAAASAGNLASVTLGIQFPTPQGATTGLVRPLEFYANELAAMGATGDQTSIQLSATLPYRFVPSQFPILLPRDRAGGSFLARAQDDAGGTIAWGARFWTWIAPRGSAAPGAR